MDVFNYALQSFVQISAEQEGSWSSVGLTKHSSVGCIWKSDPWALWQWKGNFHLKSKQTASIFLKTPFRLCISGCSHFMSSSDGHDLSHMPGHRHSELIAMLAWATAYSYSFWMITANECSKSLGKHNLVFRFLRGARRLNPPRPCLIPTWDLNLVFTALQRASFEALQSVEIKVLSPKTVILTALTSIERVWDLQSLPGILATWLLRSWLHCCVPSACTWTAHRASEPQNSTVRSSYFCSYSNFYNAYCVKAALQW